MDLNDLPCGYCCGAGPFCGSNDPDHDMFSCDECMNEPLADPHPECLQMVDDYFAEHEDDCW